MLDVRCQGRPFFLVGEVTVALTWMILQTPLTLSAT